ncbi:helix-turn-helix domain-containing protein [Fundidesulfovibrio butyratiphilus]
MSSSQVKLPPSPSGKEAPRASEFDLGFERIAMAIKTRENFTQQELAAILGIRQSSVSDAKRRGVIPGEWAIKLFRDYRLNPLWIYEGLAPKFVSGLRGSPKHFDAPNQQTFLFNHDATSFMVVSVADSSMEPVIRRDAVIGLDTREASLESGKIYGVEFPGEGLTFRRAVLEQDAFCELVTDNPIFPRCRLPIVEAKRFIRGKVAWLMQKI